MKHSDDTPVATDFDAIVVGAGFAGLYMLHKLRELGLRCRAYEAGNGVGGTWFWNRYPGARCDVESVEYSYSFSKELEQEWNWSERYAAQPEILQYANHVAERFGLFEAIEFNTRVEAAHYDDRRAVWTLRTDKGDAVTTRFCIMASGCLSTTKLPEIPGIESFQGAKYHTGQWPAEGVDFSGKRVGVIGTGSSGIQTITELAKSAGKLLVFQRTPHYSLPALNAPLQAEELGEIKRDYESLRQAARESTSGIARNPVPVQSALTAPPEERERTYEQHWFAGRNSIVRAYNDLLVDPDANATAADYVRRKVLDTVAKPEVAQALVPQHFIGTKRICLDSGYYEAFNRENVELVDLKVSPILEITPTGVRTGTAHHELDALVFATGYDAVTGAILKVDVRTASGNLLRDKWADGPRCYLGLMTAGFPNLFIVTGPGSPSILSNVIVSIEHHVEMIAACLLHMDKCGLKTIDADPKAEDAWVEHVNDLAAATLYPRADSWYMGANVPGKPRVFLPYVGGVGRYQRVCREVIAEGWRGFTFTARQSETARA